MREGQRILPSNIFFGGGIQRLVCGVKDMLYHVSILKCLFFHWGYYPPHLTKHLMISLSYLGLEHDIRIVAGGVYWNLLSFKGGGC